MKLFRVKLASPISFVLTILICICNGHPYEPSLLIANGVFTDLYNLAKYVVSIQSKDTTAHGYKHYCGGTIIGERTILTAAHCAFKPEGGRFSANELVAVAGVNNRFDRERNLARVVEIEGMRIHSLYSPPESYDYDIGVMFLKDNISSETSPIVSIARLTQYPPRRGQTCTALGWGQVFWRGPLTAELGFANVEILNTGACYTSYEKHFSKGMICAIDQNSKSGPCHGDSGGPLFCKNKVAGVISFGARCGFGSGPSAYSDVAYYKNWIESRGTTRYVNKFILIFYLTCGTCMK